MANHVTICCVAIFAFLLIFPPVATLNFSLTSFSRSNIQFQGSANPKNNSIQLTANLPGQSGIATYPDPLQLWDKASGNLTDFTTHFSFVIDSQNRTPHADGMTFFLAPFAPLLPSAGGERIGLPYNYSKDDKFVAVEFDAFQNYVDPEGDHVGIDINSIKSVITTPWSSGILDGKKNYARITYDSRSHNLTVVFTAFHGNTTVLQTLSYVVDLSKVLPEQVTFGFTASTGKYTELHEIDSWNFSSTLQIVETPGFAPMPAPPPMSGHPPMLGSPLLSGPPPTSGSPAKGKSKTGFVIGLIVGGSVLAGGSVSSFLGILEAKVLHMRRVDH